MFSMTTTVTDAFAERYFPVAGRKFVERSGTWLCELAAPVDRSPVDQRIFHLRFALKQADARWRGPAAAEQRLELRTSNIGFHFEHGHAGWLLLVISGFLDSGELVGIRDAYAIERAALEHHEQRLVAIV
jgi:hypothetical protein